MFTRFTVGIWRALEKAPQDVPSRLKSIYMLCTKAQYIQRE